LWVLNVAFEEAEMNERYRKVFGFGGIIYDIGAKSRFLTICEWVEALKFSVSYNIYLLLECPPCWSPVAWVQAYT
jgi:hypothetical protein